MLAQLDNLLREANREGRALPCFNVFNLDFLHSIIAAGEELESPLIIALNQNMVRHYTLDILIPILLIFAKKAKVPVCPHLDHTYDPGVIEKALELGLPSVMYDGSQLPLEENILAMQKIGVSVKKYGADLEGEVGSVAYADHDPEKTHIRSELTRVEDAEKIDQQAPLTALAVSVGNVHRLSEGKVEINFSLLTELSKRVSTPLVIHGTSGIDTQVIRKIARETTVAKFNIATDLRKIWGNGLREHLIRDTHLFDPLKCSELIYPELKDRAKFWINLLR